MCVRFMGRPGFLEPVGVGAAGLQGRQGLGHRAGEAAWSCSSRCPWSACHVPDTVELDTHIPLGAPSLERGKGCEVIRFIPCDGCVPSADIRKAWGEVLGSDPIPASHFMGQ